MPQITAQLKETLSSRVLAAVKEPLESKHLYQHLTIQKDDLNELIHKEAEEHKRKLIMAGPNVSPDAPSPTESGRRLSEILHKQLSALLDCSWDFEPEVHSYPGAPQKGIHQQGWGLFTLPGIKVACGNAICDGTVQPHNSGYAGLQNGVGLFELKQTIQVFSLPYHCQNCRGEPVIFLVKREGLKLTIVGRSQFPAVVIPNFIPEPEKRFYRSAVIATQTNFTLASALYLRVLIEQHFYRVVPNAEIKTIRGNPTGDELADLYAKTLPKNFPSNFPSLKKAYEDLSSIIHRDKEDEEVKSALQKIRVAIEQHFEAIQLFKKIPSTEK